MEIKDWLDKLKNPSMMTPAQIRDGYMEMSAYYAQIHTELSDTTAEFNRLLAQYLEDDEVPHNKARALALGTDVGAKMVKLGGREKSILEVIRSLKKAQQYYENEARNNY